MSVVIIYLINMTDGTFPLEIAFIVAHKLPI